MAVKVSRSPSGAVNLASPSHSYFMSSARYTGRIPLLCFMKVSADGSGSIGIEFSSFDFSFGAFSFSFSYS